jgi:hypothetical protein
MEGLQVVGGLVIIDKYQSMLILHVMFKCFVSRTCVIILS